MEQKFWHGIKDIHFIWHGAWSDPEIFYDGMLVNAPTVEDTMIERYKEYCEEEGIIDDHFDGLSDYMVEYDYDVKELIQLAWEDMPRIKATVDEKIGEISLLKQDAEKLNGYTDYYTIWEADICRQNYIWKQLEKIDTPTLSEVAAELWDLTDEFEGLCMERLSAIILLCKFTVLSAR